MTTIEDNIISSLVRVWMWFDRYKKRLPQSAQELKKQKEITGK